MKTIKFEFEKETKNTIRFKEVLADPLDPAVIGTMYIPKATLKDIGWSQGKYLVLNVTAE